MDIKGSTVLLTGASGGLGQATARYLAGKGAHLVISARNEKILDALAVENGWLPVPQPAMCWWPTPALVMIPTSQS